MGELITAERFLSVPSKLKSVEGVYCPRRTYVQVPVLDGALVVSQKIEAEKINAVCGAIWRGDTGILKVTLNLPNPISAIRGLRNYQTFDGGFEDREYSYEFPAGVVSVDIWGQEIRDIDNIPQPMSVGFRSRRESVLPVDPNNSEALSSNELGRVATDFIYFVGQPVIAQHVDSYRR